MCMLHGKFVGKIILFTIHRKLEIVRKIFVLDTKMRLHIVPSPVNLAGKLFLFRFLGVEGMAE